MSSELFLSRARLRSDAPIAALRDVLIPEGEERRTMVGHRLMWTLFGDSPERQRDFLWRETGHGTYFVLSERRPEDRHHLFDLAPAKAFAPVLRAGDVLRFSLRANATVARRLEGRSRGKPCDVVMDALYRVPRGKERAEARATAVADAGRSWLTAQGEKSGFAFAGTLGREAVRVMSYRTWRLDHRRAEMKIGVIDFEGLLTVTQSDLLLRRVRTGFGRAKAFGCGLMLLARA